MIANYAHFTTGQFYGCANGSTELAKVLLASWAGKDAVCAVGFGSKATATSCGIRNLCVWQKVSGSEAGGPTFALCKKYRWKYFVVLQEDDLSSVHEEFEALLPLAPENHLSFLTGVQREIRQDFRWMNDISYVDSENREHTIAVIECLETRSDADRNSKTTRFKWITNFNVKRNTVITLANEGGRLRWKIENEGFNVQKNGGYGLEHAYTRNATASKVFYYLLQIAHIIAQLIQ